MFLAGKSGKQSEKLRNANREAAASKREFGENVENLEKWNFPVQNISTRENVSQRFHCEVFRAMTMNEFSVLKINIVQSKFQENLWKIHYKSIEREPNN